MYSYEITDLAPISMIGGYGKAVLKNLTTGLTQYILFKEHDADKALLSVVFTNEEWTPVNSEAILNATNRHTASEIAIGDILEITK